MKSLILHAGLTKTGTSTLQRALFGKHSQIFYLGKYVNNNLPKGCLSHDVYSVLKPLFWQYDRNTDVDKLRNLYVENILPQAHDKKVLIASWEALVNNHLARFLLKLEQAKAVFGNFKLMITLRNPLTWLPSEYLQASQGQFKKMNRRIFESRPYLPFQIWLQRHLSMSGSIANWLCYTESIKDAVQLLGADNVGVFLFEELQENPDEYHTAVAEFLQIDANECLALLANEHFNKRLSKARLDYFLTVDSSLVRRLKWRFSSPGKRLRDERLNSARVSNDSAFARIELSDEWRAKVAEGTRQGHLWLAKELHLDLARYGYPL